MKDLTAAIGRRDIGAVVTALSDRFAIRQDGRLIRDLVPDSMRRQGLEPIVREAHPDELSGLVRDRLREAFAAALASGRPEDPEGLADVLEALYALAALGGLTPYDLELIRETKAATEGGYEKGLVWLGNRAGDAA